MNVRYVPNRVVRIAISSALVAFTGIAFPAEPPTSASTAPSKEARERMASMHEEMAACLRTDKSIADCRTQAMQRCQEAMRQQDCKMMGMGMGTPGMHDGMMKTRPQSTPNKK
jgi:hypothetical protein